MRIGDTARRHHPGGAGALRRLGAWAAAAAVLVLALPVPAAAAPNPSITISDVSVSEGTGSTATASFTIQAVPRPQGCCPLQVSWATAAGTATAPADFTAFSGTVSLTRTAASRVVSVPVVGDASDEPTETFVVNLSDLVGSPGRISDPQGVATITDDDDPPPLSVDDVAVAEGDAGTAAATFAVTPSIVSGKTITFDWITTAGTASAPSDFVADGGSGTIAAGASSVTFTVTVNGDVVDEVDESFSVALSDPVNATIADGSGLGTIVDDDPVPSLAIGDASVTEGNVGTAIATFTITLSPWSGKTATVAWATADDSATQPTDYLGASGTVTFAAGDTSETVAVTVNGDLVAELDEAFRVVLSSPTNATIGDGEAIGTIVDDEMLPVIDIDEPTTTEGDAGTRTIDFSVTLSHQSASVVTVDWGIAGGTATAGSDFVGATGTVTFAPFDTSETVQVVVNGDSAYEHDETFSLHLSNPVGAPIGDDRGVGTIGNDDAAPSLSVTNASVLEGDEGTTELSFAVSLIGESEVDASVDFTASGISATEGGDFLSASGTLTIPAGDVSAALDVVVNGDRAYEADETLSVALTGPVEAVTDDGTATGTIRNDDRARTRITVRARRTPGKVLAVGILEPALSGNRVRTTLFRKQNGSFAKVATKTVRVRSLGDRDGDEKQDAAYTVSFARPTTGGTYKFLVRFEGSPTQTGCKRSKVFSLTS